VNELRTPLCQVLGIEVPIIQAPIGSATCPALAAAVSNAGGLGTLALTWRTTEETRRMIRETRELTSRPFGVNLGLAWPQDERLAICLEEGVPILSFFWGPPERYTETAHGGGAIYFSGHPGTRRGALDHTHLLIGQRRCRGHQPDGLTLSPTL
jgi:nitronate monooxygenase